MIAPKIHKRVPMHELIELPRKSFLSALPKVTLINSFQQPFDNAVATARTCYSSKGIITAGQVSGEGLEEEKQQDRRQKRDDLARSDLQSWPPYHLSACPFSVRFGKCLPPVYLELFA